MDVIGHQAIRVQNASRRSKRSRQMKQVEASILIFMEAPLPIVSALDYVHGNVWQHDAGAPGHDASTVCHAAPLTRR
jgi:hypothetical protein